MNEFQNYVDNLNGMLNQSRAEFRQYEKTKQPILLQQSGEKLFCAVESYLTLKYRKRVEGFAQLRSITSEKSDTKLLYDARQLHRFFYNFRDEYGSDAEVIRLYDSVYSRLKDKIRKHLIGKYKIWRQLL